MERIDMEVMLHINIMIYWKNWKGYLSQRYMQKK